MSDFFAPPPFDADAALQKVRRQLRELNLTEREGRFEARGTAWARVRVEGDALLLDAVRAPARSPEWQTTTVRDHAQLRAWLERLARRLADAKDPDS